MRSTLPLIATLASFCCADLSALDAELAYLRTMPASTLGQTRGGRPDANGLVGANQTGAFASHNQRGAMELMIVGIALRNDTDVADAWRAVAATYAHQGSDGNFGDSAPAVVFWMCWQNQALRLLMNSEYADTYRDRLSALKPGMVKAMGYLMSQANKTQLHGADGNSPNRSHIDANAYGMATLLLGDQAGADVAGWRAEGQWWINNVYTNDKLYRSLDGVFLEGGGYDTGYQGVGQYMFIRYMIQFPGDLPDWSQRAAHSSRWLGKRILADGTVDCTDNIRSGPNNQVGDVKATDIGSLRRGLLYSGAVLGDADATGAAGRAGASINGLPPVVFSADSTSAQVGAPFTFTLMATNAGPAALSSAFSISCTNLPPGVSAANAVTYRRSTGTLVLSGVPTVPGVYTVGLATANEYGTGTGAVTITVAGSSPPVNQPPTCSLTATPVSSSSGTPIVLSATAADIDGTVVKVVFSDGAQELGEDITSADGWTFTWAGANPGTHVLTAQATDSGGAVTTSLPVTVTVAVGTGTSQPPAAPPAPIASGNHTAAPVLNGTAPGGATVHILMDGGDIASVTADNAGAWSFGLSGEPSGTHTFSVFVVTADGSSPASATTVVVITPVNSGGGAPGTDGGSTSSGTGCGHGTAVAILLASIGLVFTRLRTKW